VSDVTSVQVRLRDDGSIPVPKELLEQVNLQPQVFVMVSVEDGQLLVQRSEDPFDKVVRLLKVGLEGVMWEDIEKERQDDS